MRRRARALMIQGTGSHVGKTVLVAALCRVFRDAGWGVAPFKAQNMALNAYVTRDGGEIGWAQAMQAEAAGLEPTVDMNPILLKPQAGGEARTPKGEARTQVIVHGKVWATLDAREYYRRRAELWPAVTQAVERLARAHDLLIIEGAGSPAEPNLMTLDLTNMAVARLCRAPVILVGDIDRGGVFASLVGSLAWLARSDRRRIRGFLINKFRGAPDLLTPALELLEAKTRRPVLGVVPYLADLRLPEEDSVGLDAETPRSEAPAPLVAVIRLPHIANFTDFAPLAADPVVRLRYVSRPDEMAGAALVILPGSKDTLADLRWLRASGFDGAVLDHVARGGCLGGICGGFQMLGRAIEDPEGLEAGGHAAGLGCLPVATRLAPEKVTRRVRARLPGDDRPFDGYEIHLGRTTITAEAAPFALVEDEAGPRRDGAVSAGGRVWGTYLHGLFDAEHVRRALLGGLAADSRAAPPIGDYHAVREQEYARLATHVREHVDLPALMRLARLG